MPEVFIEARLDLAPGMRMSLLPTDVAHQAIAFTGVYEPELSDRLIPIARAGGLLVDVGANYGYFSLLWLAHHLGNRVIAFEASPRNQVRLRENLAANQAERRVDLRTCAVGRHAGRAHFATGPDDQTGWGGLAQAGQHGFEVDVVRLDEVLADEPHIDVLKIDIEGADTWAILGAEQLLRKRRIRHLFFEENHERMQALGIAPDEAPHFLRRMGYQVELLTRTQGLREYHARIP